MNTGRVVAYIDGGARGNPGPAGYGVHIETAEGTLVHELTGAIGIATNNIAEYRGLLAALTYLEEGGYRDIVIRSDSQLLTKQMRGEYRVRHPTLRVLHGRATALVGRLPRVRFEHVPRSENAAADRLANAAMDAATADAVPDGGDPPNSGPAVDAPRLADTLAPPMSAARTIIGVGMDVEEVARVGQLLERYGDRFLHRVFTDAEAAYSLRRRHPAQHLTGRFAAKEAAMKALGTGHSRGVLWKDIEVVRVGGPPQLQFHGGARRRFQSLAGSHSLVTITHTHALALAQVLLLAD